MAAAGYSPCGLAAGRRLGIPRRAHGPRRVSSVRTPRDCEIGICRGEVLERLIGFEPTIDSLAALGRGSPGTDSCTKGGFHPPLRPALRFGLAPKSVVGADALGPCARLLASEE